MSKLFESAVAFYMYIRIQYELRGRKQVRTIISQLVLVVVFFKGLVWNFKLKKNYMMSNMFYFSVISLVISRLNCLRQADIRLKGNSLKVLLFLSSSLGSNGASIFSFWIQKLSLITKISVSHFLEPCRLINLSRMMNLESLLKSYSCLWKYLKAGMELGFLVSFLWLFIWCLSCLQFSKILHLASYAFQ